MKTLDTLIRLARFDVDERRRDLALLLEREDAVRAQIAGLEADVARERALAEATPELAASFGAYAARVRERRAAMEQELATLEPVIDHARDRLAEAYEEQKKIEITRDRRLEAEAAEENRREQQVLDEIGIVNHGRKT